MRSLHNLVVCWLGDSCSLGSDSGQVTIPEPSTVILMGLGLVGLGYVGRRKLVS
jgi:hypothetical protein